MKVEDFVNPRLETKIARCCIVGCTNSSGMLVCAYGEWWSMCGDHLYEIEQLKKTKTPAQTGV